MFGCFRLSVCIGVRTYSHPNAGDHNFAQSRHAPLAPITMPCGSFPVFGCGCSISCTAFVAVGARADGLCADWQWQNCCVHYSYPHHAQGSLSCMRCSVTAEEEHEFRSDYYGVVVARLLVAVECVHWCCVRRASWQCRSIACSCWWRIPRSSRSSYSAKPTPTTTLSDRTPSRSNSSSLRLPPR